MARGPLRQFVYELFHEFPLVLFSTLASAACGSGAAWWAVYLDGGWSHTPPPGLSGTASLLMAAALLFSLLHLGRPLRSGLALRGLRTSYLSWEVLVAATFFFSAAATRLLGAAPAASWTWLAAAIAAPGFFAALAQVYRLRGQLTWGYRTSLSSLLLGTAGGLLLVRIALPTQEILGLAGLLIVLDLSLLLSRWRWYGAAAARGRPEYPALFGARSWLLGARVVLADLMPLLYLFAPGGGVRPAVGFLFFGLLLDRFLFYGLAVRRSTTSEIERVGDLIRQTTP